MLAVHDSKRSPGTLLLPGDCKASDTPAVVKRDGKAGCLRPCIHATSCRAKARDITLLYNLPTGVAAGPGAAELEAQLQQERECTARLQEQLQVHALN